MPTEKPSERWHVGHESRHSVLDGDGELIGVAYYGIWPATETQRRARQFAKSQEMFEMLKRITDPDAIFDDWDDARALIAEIEAPV